MNRRKSRVLSRALQQHRRLLRWLYPGAEGERNVCRGTGGGWSPTWGASEKEKEKEKQSEYSREWRMKKRTKRINAQTKFLKKKKKKHGWEKGARILRSPFRLRKCFFFIYVYTIYIYNT